MRKAFKPIRAVLLSLTLIAGFFTAAALPAQAQDYLEICNSVNSVGTVKITSTWHGGFPLTRGSCNTFRNSDGSVRVDPDVEAYGYADVDSYQKGIEGRGYYECVNGEGEVNPPNDTDGLYWKINTNRGFC